jgi:uncharacterized membrane protein YphA (DoxX/SURF4 family)
MPMQLLNTLARYLVGVLFIISGLIKLNDPVGTQIKLEEYFDVFATDFGSVFHYFIPLALFLSIFLSTLEVVLGIALLIRYRPRLVTSLLLGLIVFFTFLTFYSAYFEKVTDCGCFGDAIKLTPWQSFTKDIILLILIGWLFINRSKLAAASEKRAMPVVLGSFVLSLIISLYAYWHLPYIDFRAYKPGADIGQAMQPTEPYRYAYIMEKDGKEVELETYPAASEGYTYKDVRLLNPEAQPKITDFAIWNKEGDFTEGILQGNYLLIVIHKVEKADTDELDEIMALAKEINPSIQPLLITSSGEESFQAFRHEHQLALPYYFGDATLLKTMIRANPGLILLQDGKVLAKWHNNDVPAAKEVRERIGQL